MQRYQSAESGETIICTNYVKTSGITGVIEVHIPRGTPEGARDYPNTAPPSREPWLATKKGKFMKDKNTTPPSTDSADRDRRLRALHARVELVRRQPRGHPPQLPDIDAMPTIGDMPNIYDMPAF